MSPVRSPYPECLQSNAIFTAHVHRILSGSTETILMESGNPSNLNVGLFLRKCKATSTAPSLVYSMGWLCQAYMVKAGNNPATKRPRTRLNFQFISHRAHLCR